MEVLIIVYLIIGVFVVAFDFFQPVYNQPEYIRSKNWFLITLMLFIWPLKFISRFINI